MHEYGRFVEDGYEIVAYMPSSRKDACEWLVQAYQEKELVKELRIPMDYFPLFGPDVSDVSRLEENTEELLQALCKK